MYDALRKHELEKRAELQKLQFSRYYQRGSSMLPLDDLFSQNVNEAEAEMRGSFYSKSAVCTEVSIP